MKQYELGLDLGVQSIGWSIKIGNKIQKMGVHCFDSGTGTSEDISSGKDESRNAVRQTARSLRRQVQRRSQRAVNVARVLQQCELLPQFDEKNVKYNPAVPEDRDRLIKDLDWELFAKFINEGDRVEAHLLPYLLRARALDKKLEAYEFGRALYHLAKRRGYLSNRKAVKETDSEEDEGKVAQGISEIESEMKKKKARTLGEYFAALDPEETRIRQRYTSRQMYLDEFEAIWNKQAKFNKNLTDEAKALIHHAIFFQRPLKSMRSKLGKCELETDKRRAPVACMEFQRFRYWQKLIDLSWRAPDGDWTPLTSEQLAALADALEQNEGLTFTEIKTLLGLKKNVKINLAEGGEKKIKGNVTAARLQNAIPSRWKKMNQEQQDALVAEILQFEREDALARRLMKAFNFNATEAETVAATFLENGWASYSKAALNKILPYMIENRAPLSTAVKALYNTQKKQQEIYPLLPPLENILGDLRNPVVARTLSELRKVVNSIIRHAQKLGRGDESGKPKRIFIELGRDMKKSRKERERSFKQNRANETSRAAAKKKIIQEAGIADPKPNDILKVLLAEESNWQCPYTGKTITMKTLFGMHPQFDIEHILPFSRSLDNSYTNKTLCDAKFNRDVKRNQTPFECASGNPDEYHKMLERVKRFSNSNSSGRGGNPKLRRFLMEAIPSDFSSRMLNDTRYISRQACEYLGALYGGQIDRSENESEEDVGERKIFVCTGQATAWLRREWNLNSILNDGDEKNRTDHRHHAIDAVAIVYCAPGIVQRLARAAEESERLNDKRRLFLKGEVETPYSEFLNDIRNKTDSIHVSYRCNRKISGALHKETNYSKEHLDIVEKESKSGTAAQSKKSAQEKPVEYRYLRKPLASMSNNDIDNIVDPAIRKLVQDKLARLGGNAKAFSDPKELPYRMVKSPDGSERLVPIKKARFRQIISTKKIGNGVNSRYVATGGNHHMEVYAELDAAGREIKWVADTVTLFDAYERKIKRLPVINRDHGPNTVYKFTLFKNEFLEITNSDGSTTLKRVFKFSGQRVGFGDHNDARPANDVTDKTPGNYPSINSLRGKAQKVSVDLWGDIHPAND